MAGSIPDYTPRPDETLERILNSPTRAVALERLTKALAVAWSHGNIVGFSEGASDANDDEPRADTVNPYRT